MQFQQVRTNQNWGSGNLWQSIGRLEKNKDVKNVKLLPLDFSIPIKNNDQKIKDDIIHKRIMAIK